MRTFFFTIIAFSICTSCGLKNHDEHGKDNCSDQIFTNIDSALSCDADSKNYKSLLFEFVSKDIEKYKKLGWSVLKDKDIIKTAKRDYVLIVIDQSRINLTSHNMPQELISIIKKQKNEPYFVVTNRAFYPFREFDLSVDKEKIIDDLSIGEGP